MPVNESHCGRRQPHRHNFKLNGVHSEHGQDPWLVNGTMTRDNITYSHGPSTIKPAQAATHNSTNPKKMNGNVSHGFWSKSTPGVSKKQDETFNSNSKAEQPESDGSVSVNGARSLETQPTPTAVFDQKPAKHDLQTTSKNQRRKKKPWHNKRKKVASAENVVHQAPEDWEKEIQEVNVSNWEKMTFGTEPYGPEDIVNFSLRNLSLERTITPLWQVTSNKYLPATHHRRPVEWFRYKPRTEPGQFSDVED